MLDVRKFSNPWGAVYAADGRGNKIGSGPAFGRSTSPWRLYSLFVSNTRYWSASSARFTVVRPILPGTDGLFGQRISIEKEFANFRGNGLEGLPILEDAIVMEAGYANALFTDTNIAMRERIFFGFIETINVSVSMKGVKVTMSCRDSLRFLIDNKFSGQIFNDNFQIYQQTGFDSFRNGAAIPLSTDEVDEALECKPIDGLNAGTLDKHKIIAWLIYAGSNGGCLPGKLIDNGAEVPANRACIERSNRPVLAPKDNFGSVQGFNVMNRSPLEVIKHLGSLEAEPRELFADQYDGRISWVRRDLQKMDDPWQFCTLVNFPPESSAAGQAPNVLDTQADWSTIGTISELVVVNPVSEVAGANKALNGAGVLNVSGRLPDNRFFPQFIGEAFNGIKSFVRRTRFIFDDTIGPGDVSSAKALIDAMFRIWGKDLRAGTFQTFGNPFLRCGDALQIWNFGLFDGQIFRAEAIEHSLIASGPRKGYRTRVSWAGTDQERIKALSKVEHSIENAPNGKGTYFFHDEPSERAAVEKKLGKPRVTTIGDGNGGQF